MSLRSAVVAPKTAFGGARRSQRSAVPPRRSALCICNAIKIYTNPGSRGKICEWALDELGLKYESVTLDMRAGDHKKPEFLRVNPFGKVPGLEDDGVTVFESGAILLYLYTKYSKATMSEPAQVAAASQWVLFSNSTFCEVMFNGQRQDAKEAMLATLDGVVSKQPYFGGKDFTVADIAMGAYLLYLPLFFPTMPLNKYSNLWAYMKRLADRPTCPVPYKEAFANAEKAVRK